MSIGCIRTFLGFFVSVRLGLWCCCVLEGRKGGGDGGEGERGDGGGGTPFWSSHATNLSSGLSNTIQPPFSSLFSSLFSPPNQPPPSRPNQTTKQLNSNTAKSSINSSLSRDQIVTLETEGGARARVKGITKDYGLLRAEELSIHDDRPTGKIWELQSDSNSFDFWKGLVRRKV